MKLEERFHEDVIQFEVEKIAMIGNNRTGNLIGLTEEGKKAVANIWQKGSCEITPEIVELCHALKQGGYFENEDTEKNRILSAYLHVTDRCNLHCIGCYSYVTERNTKINLSYQEICHILMELMKNGVKIIVISGGEPFLREDIGLICKYAKQLGMIVQVITNGTMLQERYLEALPFIDAISVSVDGYKNDPSPPA